MEFFADMPLGWGEWVLASIVIAMGAALQVATGVGLGLLAGPVLVFTMGSGAAIFVAIVLNLVISLVVMPQERTQILKLPLRNLIIGSVVGIPLGWVILDNLNVVALKLLIGAAILLAGIQLIWSGRRRDNTAGSKPRLGLEVSGGTVSGVMCGSLAMPGPVAMWAMMQADYPPSGVRATMRALFILSYGAALAAHLILGGSVAGGWSATVAMLPALFAGTLAAAVAKSRIGEAALKRAFNVLLVTMGLGLLVQTLYQIS